MQQNDRMIGKHVADAPRQRMRCCSAVLSSLWKVLGLTRSRCTKVCIPFGNCTVTVFTKPTKRALLLGIHPEQTSCPNNSTKRVQKIFYFPPDLLGLDRGWSTLIFSLSKDTHQIDFFQRTETTQSRVGSKKKRVCLGLPNGRTADWKKEEIRFSFSFWLVSIVDLPILSPFSQQHVWHILINHKIES